MDPGPDTQSELSSSQLKDAAVSGIRWTTAARVGSEFVTFFSAVVLARLIPPSGFGQALVPTIVAKREGILDEAIYNAPPREVGMDEAVAA